MGMHIVWAVEEFLFHFQQKQCSSSLIQCTKHKNAIKRWNFATMCFKLGGRKSNKIFIKLLRFSFECCIFCTLCWRWRKVEHVQNLPWIQNVMHTDLAKGKKKQISIFYRHGILWMVDKSSLSTKNWHNLLNKHKKYLFICFWKLLDDCEND